MGSGVKSIFKLIIGTIFGLLVFLIMVELYNVTVSAYLLKSVINNALTRSADYFAQETYKNGSGNLTQLVGYNGEIDTTLNGQFYYGSDIQTYNRLYGYEDFRDYSLRFKEYYRKLKVLSKALGHHNDSLLYGEDAIGDYYIDGMVTPLNIGIAYLDKNTLNKIFKWSLVSTLMGGNRDMLIVNPVDNSQPYVVYKGFRVYYNSIAVTDIDYKVYNLFDSNQAKEFYELTNIDVNNYINKSKLTMGDERSKVMVATLVYNIKVGYEGITPIKRMFQWAVNTNGSSRNSDSWETRDGDTTLSKAGARNQDLSGGGTDFSNAVDIHSKIVYYIIR